MIIGSSSSSVRLFSSQKTASFRRRPFRAGVARWLPGLAQQFVHFMLEVEDAHLPSYRGIVPAAQIIDLFGKLGFRLLALGDVANNRGEELTFVGLPLRQRKFQRKLAAVFAQPGKLDGFTDH